MSMSMSMSMPTMMISQKLSVKVRASSLDTQQRLPYNPHRTKPKKPPPPPLPLTNTRIDLSLSNLLSRNHPQNPNQEGFDENYLGHETWLPSPPQVEKPRSIYNAASLAYIGDCIYELYARQHFLFPLLNIEEYNDCVMAVVRCEAQSQIMLLKSSVIVFLIPGHFFFAELDSMLQKLLHDNVLSEQERDVLRWGKNIGGSAKTRTKKRAGVAVYNRASSLETLVGYLYLTNAKRLEKIMLKLGFRDGAST
ncbi:hypothetical protein LguiA_010002 [Lonicera macranthoides]